MAIIRLPLPCRLAVNATALVLSAVTGTACLLPSALYADIYIPPVDPAAQHVVAEQIRAYNADRSMRASVEAMRVEADAAIARASIESLNATMVARSGPLPPLQALPALLETAGRLGQAHAASLAELASANAHADSERYSATTDMVTSIFDAKVRHDVGLAQVAASAVTGMPVGGLGGGGVTPTPSTGRPVAAPPAGGGSAPRATTAGDVPSDMTRALERQAQQYRSREAADEWTGGGGSFRGRGASGGWGDSGLAGQVWDDLNGPGGLFTVGRECFGDVALDAWKDLLDGNTPTPPNPLEVAWCALTTGWDIGDGTLRPEPAEGTKLRDMEQQLRHGPPTVHNAELLKALEQLRNERATPEARSVPPIDPNAGRPSIGTANR